MTLQEYKPKWRWVVVELIDVTKTGSGLYIPTATVISSPIVKVLAVGPDCSTTKEGDTVMLENLQIAKSIDFADSGTRKIYSVMEQQIMGSFEESKPVKKKK